MKNKSYNLHMELTHFINISLVAFFINHGIYKGGRDKGG